MGCGRAWWPVGRFEGETAMMKKPKDAEVTAMQTIALVLAGLT